MSIASADSSGPEESLDARGDLGRLSGLLAPSAEFPDTRLVAERVKLVKFP